jgi:hypothetical protein
MHVAVQGCALNHPTPYPKLKRIMVEKSMTLSSLSQLPFDNIVMCLSARDVVALCQCSATIRCNCQNALRVFARAKRIARTWRCRVHQRRIAFLHAIICVMEGGYVQTLCGGAAVPDARSCIRRWMKDAPQFLHRYSARVGVECGDGEDDDDDDLYDDDDDTVNKAVQNHRNRKTSCALDVIIEVVHMYAILCQVPCSPASYDREWPLRVLRSAYANLMQQYLPAMVGDVPAALPEHMALSQIRPLETLIIDQHEAHYERVWGDDDDDAEQDVDLAAVAEQEIPKVSMSEYDAIEAAGLLPPILLIHRLLGCSYICDARVVH